MVAAPRDEDELLLGDELHRAPPFRGSRVVVGVILARRSAQPSAITGRHALGERARRHVVGHDRARAGRRRRRRPRPARPATCWIPVCTSVADLGAVLVAAVVVGGDRAGADVRAGADLGVADVGEVRHLGALADLGVLHLDERADLARRRRGACPGAGTRTGPTWQSSPISALARDACSRSRRRSPTTVSTSCASGPIDRAGADRRCGPRGSCPGSSRTSGSSSTVASM